MGDKSNGHLPGFKVAYGAIDFELALVAVGDVHFYERRYKGQLIDLGKFDADIGISFWYTSKLCSLLIRSWLPDYSDPQA